MNYIKDIENLLCTNPEIITNDRVFYFRSKTEEYIQNLESYLNACQGNRIEHVINEVENIAKKERKRMGAIMAYQSANGNLEKFVDIAEKHHELRLCNIKTFAEEPYFSMIGIEAEKYAKIECWADFRDEYFCCCNGIVIEAEKLRKEFLPAVPKTVYPDPEAKAPTNTKLAPLFTLKGDPDKEKATRIYTKLAGAYINCSVDTFLHFFYDSAIKPDEDCIKWIYGRGKKKEGPNTKLLQFIDLITNQSNENRPLANIGATFNRGKIPTSTEKVTDAKLNRAIKKLFKDEGICIESNKNLNNMIKKNLSSL